MSYLDRIKTLHAFQPDGHVDLIISGHCVGHVPKTMVAHLSGYQDVLVVSDRAVRVSDRLATYDARTEALRAVLLDLRRQGLFPGWREEAYAVKTTFNAPALMEMERAAVPMFGVEGYGVHVNGYVRKSDGLYMWVGRRAKDKPTFPGQLDQMVAGGLPAGMDILENLVKECGEEASIPAELARRARPVGTTSYLTVLPEYGVRNDVLFNYDLELPADFTPANIDGEMDAFYLWPIEKVMETIAASAAFKYNCAAIVVDFLIRWGYIGPSHPDYVALVQGLNKRPNGDQIQSPSSEP